jgi:hypothetical protein
MKRILILRLLAIFCTVVLPILLPAEALAQRKLVRFFCGNNSHIRCSEIVYVEEDIHDDLCQAYPSENPADIERMLYSTADIILDFIGSKEHLMEFSELCPSGIIDSSNVHLLEQAGLDFLAMFKESWGFESAVANSAYWDSTDRSGPPMLSVLIKSPGMYNLWSVRQLWATSNGLDTSDARTVFDSENIQLPMCAVLTSTASEQPSMLPLIEATLTQLRLTGVEGAFTITDINARVVTQGFMRHGDAPKPSVCRREFMKLPCQYPASRCLCCPRGLCHDTSAVRGPRTSFRYRLTKESDAT